MLLALLELLLIELGISQVMLDKKHISDIMVLL
jgi:hypothetical protein